MPFCDDQRILYLKFMNRIYTEMRLRGEDCASAAILHAVWIGFSEGRSWDITSLAMALNMPRQTVGRKIRHLEKEGWVKTGFRGRAAYLEPTMQYLKVERPRVDDLLLQIRELAQAVSTRSK